MIIDSLERLSRYCDVHSGFAAAGAFLAGKELSTLPDGEYLIDGRNVFAIVQTCRGRGKKDSPLETHRDYVDIQIAVSGEDTFGWRPIEQCNDIKTPYDPEKDIAFYNDYPAVWLPLTAGNFVIFYPEDAHAPLAGDGPVKKIIIKISIKTE